MHTQLIDDFVQTLIGSIPDEHLSVVRDKMSVFFYNYDVEEKETSVVVYENPVPVEVSKYLATLVVSGSSKATVKHYKLILDMFFVSLNKKLSEIKKDDVVYYLACYKENRNVKNSTLDGIRTIISTFFKWCFDNEMIDKNPCSTIKAIKFHQEKETPLNDFQVESVRSKCKNKRDLAIVDFLLSTGCRISETLNIKIGDIDFENKRILVLGKGNKKRFVYINGKAAYSLNEYLTDRDTANFDEYLFVSLRKPYKKIKKEAIEKMLRIVGSECGIERLHPHLFRKTMSTSALSKGMKITTVQQVLGHTNIETTMRYVNITDEEIENEHRKFVS